MQFDNRNNQAQAGPKRAIKIEFSFLKANLVVPASRPFIFTPRYQIDT